MRHDWGWHAVLRPGQLAAWVPAPARPLCCHMALVYCASCWWLYLGVGCGLFLDGSEGIASPSSPLFVLGKLPTPTRPTDTTCTAGRKALKASDAVSCQLVAGLVFGTQRFRRIRRSRRERDMLVESLLCDVFFKTLLL